MKNQNLKLCEVMYICPNELLLSFFFSLAMDNRDELVQQVNLFLYVQMHVVERVIARTPVPGVRLGTEQLGRKQESGLWRRAPHSSPISFLAVASSRRSVSWGAARKKRQSEKRRERLSARSERTPVGKLNKRPFRYTRSCYTL